MASFEYEELIADMLDITDEERDADPEAVENAFYERFDIDFNDAEPLVRALLKHVPVVKGPMQS